VKPVAWTLQDTRTGKLLLTKVYVKEETARSGAEKQSSRWRSYTAVPLFLNHQPQYVDQALMEEFKRHILRCPTIWAANRRDETGMDNT